MSLKVMTPEEVNEYSDKLRAINNFIQLALSDTTDYTHEALMLIKREIKRKVQKELDEITKEIMDKLNPVLQDAIKKYTKCTALLNVPGSPDQLPSYLIDVAQALFGNQQTELMSVLASYVEPLTRLTSELNRTRNLANQLLSGTTINFKAPDLSKELSPGSW